MLDEFEFKIGLPSNLLPGPEEEYKKYLSMDISVLEKLTQADCANIGYRLAQFALYIQRCLNKEKAQAKLLGSKIRNIIAPKIRQYSGQWDLQRASAIQDDDVARKLDEDMILTEQKIERLEFVANGIKSLTDQMKNIQFTKKDS